MQWFIDVYGVARKGIIDKISPMQKRAVRCIGSAHCLHHSLPISKQLHILYNELHRIKQTYMLHRDLGPYPIRQMFDRDQQLHRYDTRQRSDANKVD